jgi:lipopolysaccharide export system protein LptC
MALGHMDQLTAAKPDLSTARSYWTMRRGDTERAFRAARSHSRTVRALRLAVPIGMLVVVAGFVLWTWFNPMRLLLSIPSNIGGDLVVSGTKITMQQPRISGFTRDRRPYEFTARAAAQDLTRPDVVELQDLNGKFQMQDNSSTEVTAQSGTYNSKNETLELGRHTVVTSTAGYKVLLDESTIDIRATTLVTEQPVQVEMKQGRLDAKRMEVLESGNVLRFDGVRMDLKGDQFMPPQPGGTQK